MVPLDSARASGPGRGPVDGSGIHGASGPAVVFEGLDGTGKSRLAELLCAREGFVCRRTPDPAFAQLRQLVHDLPRTALLMYLSACAYAIEGSAGRRDAPARLVVDRYAFSSVVQFGWVTGLPAGDCIELLDRVRSVLPAPQLTVLLVAERSVRLARLQARDDRGLGDRSVGFERYWMTCARLLRQAAVASGPGCSAPAGSALGSVITVRTDTDDTERPLGLVRAALTAQKQGSA
jgi:thymidylate kinase